MNRTQTVRLDHIGIVVSNMDALRKVFTDLGLQQGDGERVASQGVEAMLMTDGSASVELIRPTSDQSGAAKFLDKQYGKSTLHHVALTVDDIESKVAELKALGYQSITDGVVDGAFGKRIIFLHPKSCGGVLIELCEKKHEP